MQIGNLIKKTKKNWIRITIFLLWMTLSWCTKVHMNTITTENFSLSFKSKNIYKKRELTENIRQTTTLDPTTLSLYLPEDIKDTSSISSTKQRIPTGESYENLYKKNLTHIKALFSWQKEQKEIYFTKDNKEIRIITRTKKQKKTEYFTQAFRKKGKNIIIISYLSNDKNETNAFIKGIKKITFTP